MSLDTGTFQGSKICCCGLLQSPGLRLASEGRFSISHPRHASFLVCKTISRSPCRNALQRDITFAGQLHCLQGTSGAWHISTAHPPYIHQAARSPIVQLHAPTTPTELCVYHPCVPAAQRKPAQRVPREGYARQTFLSPSPAAVTMTVEQADERAAALDAHCGALRSALEQLAGEDDPARQQGLATAGSLALLDIKVPGFSVSSLQLR